MNWLSPCLFVGHEEPIRVTVKNELHLQCPRCFADFGVVLPGQRYKARRDRKPRKQSSATVLKLERKKA